jgi:hypothetical protein
MCCHRNRQNAAAQGFAQDQPVRHDLLMVAGK